MLVRDIRTAWRRMAKQPGRIAVLACAVFSIAGCDMSPAEPQPETRNENWQTVGGTHAEQFYSSLDLINDTNVGTLGLAWFADFDTRRGQEANVVMVDGVLYTSTAWSKVYAFDARTGRQLWKFDPEVPGKVAYVACCDVVNRGVAVSGGKVFVGTLDGRLIALNTRTGNEIWDIQTTDPDKPYTITGAPRVAGDLVLIGNGGGEYGVRGYVTAYDTETGKQVWRFYIVPGDPDAGPDNAVSDPALAKAIDSWAGKWYEYGGGGTAWDAIVYDKQFDQILVGTGNGSPWNRRVRSDGQGDNQYLSSILALDAKTGEYRWHYQETPGESWDFTAAQPIILADLKFGDSTRPVLMHAPKNGFFYVLDRKDGTLISANNYVPVNWAEGIDPETGRPIENPAARYEGTSATFNANPGVLGAHSWHPMAYSPRTGLVYIPVQHLPFSFKDQGPFTFNPGEYNVGVTSRLDLEDRADEAIGGEIVAWDPIKREAAWRISQPTAGNGGILATGGNLIFQGSPNGTFNAYDARDGLKLWKADVQTGIIAAASTYMLDGEQYIAVVAGYGGAVGMIHGIAPQPAPQPNGRLLVFKLAGSAELPELDMVKQAPNPPAQRADEKTVAAGGFMFGNCAGCHGTQALGNALLPDLRRSPLLTDPDGWQNVVHDGALEQNGMVGFSGKLSPKQIEAIRLYVGEQARNLAESESPAE